MTSRVELGFSGRWWDPRPRCPREEPERELLLEDPRARWPLPRVEAVARPEKGASVLALLGAGCINARMAISSVRFLVDLHADQVLTAVKRVMIGTFDIA